MEDSSILKILSWNGSTQKKRTSEYLCGLSWVWHGLTIRAVFILGSIDGAVRLHLQLEALSTGEPGHNALQLGLWEEESRKETLTAFILSNSHVISWTKSSSLQEAGSVGGAEAVCVPATGPSGPKIRPWPQCNVAHNEVREEVTGVAWWGPEC